MPNICASASIAGTITRDRINVMAAAMKKLIASPPERPAGPDRIVKASHSERKREALLCRSSLIPTTVGQDVRAVRFPPELSKFRFRPRVWTGRSSDRQWPEQD